MRPISACVFRRLGDRRAPRHGLCSLQWLALAQLAVMVGCGGDAEPGVVPESSSFLPANAAARGGCDAGGLVRTTIYGALDGDVDWSGEAMDCEGMPRPDGEGVRLRFAGFADTIPLAIIIGVDGIGPQETAAELPTNVTIIEEGQGRFFSTSDLENCWTDIERHEAIDADTGRYAIDGMLYCISPLAEVNGSGSLSIPELRFSGLVDWGPS